MNELDKFNRENLLESARQQLQMAMGLGRSLDMLIKSQEETVARLDAHDVQIDRHGHQISHVMSEIQMNHKDWSVAAWMAENGHPDVTQDVMKDEGTILRSICIRRGIAVVKEKVNIGGSRFPARQWPCEAIRIWWPDCCARHGWRETWPTWWKQ